MRYIICVNCRKKERSNGAGDKKYQHLCYVCMKPKQVHMRSQVVVGKGHPDKKTIITSRQLSHIRIGGAKDPFK